ncbi:Nramp family divalent metal transporter [Mycobacterium stomatepiae]|uniref:Divalent metal cation transporter MntH n=1 Tax=Mycobacterium stomatepiae TaxID=470076 RepID=A0A7I7QH75_9MYCO|nr:Nramp family divalent metal transporter [Mycobacterium stomatepiae]MCV7166150.1 Nramp family divalent metal transporter [Mycobacterium stomatepiae]BBY25669.1 divalent metal cation transporter MntH [Mycobacterium stomatepiae]
MTVTHQYGGVALADVQRRGRARTAFALVGPAFVASVAYVDPGNFATNFAAGGGYGYELVWVVVMANLMAILVQYLAAKVGIATGQNLAELCRRHYNRWTNVGLWLQAEIVAMATDLSEFVGAAVGLNLVFGLPLLPAGVVTAGAAFAILSLQQRGYRRFELVIIAMVAFVAIGFLYVFLAVGHQHYGQLVAGLVPQMTDRESVGLAVSIVGATVMPHVVYLHSALHINRVHAVTLEDRRILLRFNKWDCIIGLGSAGVVNLAMLCVAAALFHRPGLTNINDLGSVHAHLATLLGEGVALAFAIALLAAGLSSSSVGTYAGQVVMGGFMNWRIPLMVRRALTVLPALIILALTANTTQVLVLSQIVLSFGIPFALIPLILLSRRTDVMAQMVSRKITTTLTSVITAVITCLNAYLLYTTFAGWMS